MSAEKQSAQRGILQLDLDKPIYTLGWPVRCSTLTPAP